MCCLGRVEVRFLAATMRRCVMVDESYKGRREQPSRLRCRSREGGARKLPKTSDDDIQSVMKNRDAVPKQK